MDTRSLTTGWRRFTTALIRNMTSWTGHGRWGVERCPAGEKQVFTCWCALFVHQQTKHSSWKYACMAKSGTFTWQILMLMFVNLHGPFFTWLKQKRSRAMWSFSSRWVLVTFADFLSHCLKYHLMFPSLKFKQHATKWNVPSAWLKLWLLL